MDNKKTILIVEDDSRLRTLYTAVLENSGHEVKSAADFDEAKQLLDETWDMLLLDVMLPGTDGLTALKHISEHKLKKGKIVMLTNLNSEEIIKDSFKYGADGYIIKSNTDPVSLLKEVNTYLE